MLKGRKGFVFLFAFTVIFCFADVAFCASTDLEIKPKVITERGYSDAAVTDKYDIELLTEDSYNQAQEISQNRMLEYEKAQADLFAKDNGYEEANNVNAVIEDLGLFKKGYSVTEKTVEVQEADVNFVLSALIILLGIGIGVGLSIAVQRRNGRKGNEHNSYI